MSRVLDEGRLRPAELRDVQGIYDLYLSILHEHVFFAAVPEDPIRSFDEQRALLKAVYARENSLAWVYSLEEKVIGSLFLFGGILMRTEHRAELELQVAEGYRGFGLGRLLLSRALEAAQSNHFLQKIQLSVIADNEAAIALYRQQGFEEEGFIKDSFREPTGVFRSEIRMGRWL